MRVTLADFAIASSHTAFVPLKRYRFIVRNDGSLGHELLILPPVKPGLMTPEAMRALALGVVEARDLPPGGSHVLDLAFDRAYPAGTLELACHIVGHYEAGQRLPIVVGWGAARVTPAFSIDRLRRSSALTDAARPGFRPGRAACRFQAGTALGPRPHRGTSRGRSTEAG